MNSKNSLIFLAGSSVIALSLAYIAQFVFGLEPCILCLYQRKIFFAIIACAILGLAFFKSPKYRQNIVLCSIMFLALNCAVSLYHVGVEQKIFAGPVTCSSSQDLNEITDIQALEAAFAKSKAIRCDEPAFVFLKISMAGWNFLYCVALIIITALSPSRFQALSKFCKFRSNNR